MKRLLWIDISKALAILFVVYFHFFATYFQHGVLPPPDWSDFAASTLTILRLAWLKISGLGFHAVGVFIILSGWTLMQSTARRAEAGEISWAAWYRARFLRLYPMYWVAHLVYLVSPFVARLEPVDGRIILSLLGLRFIDIQMNFMYLNAAWWYFSMLIQFYLIFPLLFWTARRDRAFAVFANRMCRGIFRALRFARAMATKRLVGPRRLRDLSITRICTRDVARDVVHAITSALGMVPSSRRGIRGGVNSLPCRPAALSRPVRIHFCRFRHGRVLHAGDRGHRRVHCAFEWTSQTIRTGRTLFLRPLSYSSTLRHLARPPDSRSADLGISVDLHPGARCPQCLGHALGKRN